MKQYTKEIIIFLIQLITFYIFPLSMHIFEPMGTVLLMLIITLILSTILTIISKNKIKYLYPIIISILFLPTIFIYYNESALIHSIWYLVISIIGFVIGTIINLIIKSRKEE